MEPVSMISSADAGMRYRPVQASHFMRPGVAHHASAQKIDAIAQDFEAQFLSQMLENMFSTVDTDTFLGGGEAEETYRSFLIDEYGKIMTRAGGIGVADYVKREMLRMQEV